MAAARKMRALMEQPKNNRIYYPSKFNLTDEEALSSRQKVPSLIFAGNQPARSLSFAQLL